MTYYDRYKKQANLFQAAGILLIALAVLINELSHRSFAPPVWVLAGIGVIPLMIGGSSARPHAIVKSFAILLKNDPSTENAGEFLNALQKTGKVALVKPSRDLVETALYTYEHSPEAEEKMVENLREAVGRYIIKKRF